MDYVIYTSFTHNTLLKCETLFRNAIGFYGTLIEICIGLFYLFKSFLIIIDAALVFQRNPGMLFTIVSNIPALQP